MCERGLGSDGHMPKEATLSTVIDAEVKRAVTEYCRRKGLKIRHVVERALIEQLEDEIDLQAYEDRRDEDTVSLQDLLASRSKGRRRR